METGENYESSYNLNYPPLDSEYNISLFNINYEEFLQEKEEE